MNVLVTGSRGFLGKHLMEALSRRADVQAVGYDLENTAEELNSALARADVIYHLAGVNRPPNPVEYETGNVGLTQTLCHSLRSLGRLPRVVLSSSIQAVLDNPYGISKYRSEEVLRSWCQETGGACVIFRLKNVFGKQCRPNYNSVVATFCHNIAHDLPVTISDTKKVLDLVYIDDVVEAFLKVLDEQGGEPALRKKSFEYRDVPRSFKVTLGDLAERIASFRQSRKTLKLPSMADEFNRCLYATFLSYLADTDFAYNLDLKRDNRGCLAEFLKSDHFGQLFVSRTKPGITRGNHYHHTKTEKFMVVEGEAIVRLRPLMGECRASLPGGRSNTEIIEYRVSGSSFQVVDIPPGYTHSIENIGNGELVVLFWASEIFDAARPDTIAAPVLSEV